ncbi:MAG: terminase family protein [Pseudomonadota bacterium]|nr:terminase family protein [Pseudomonadota bacterium]
MAATTKAPKRKTGKLSNAEMARMVIQRARDSFPAYCVLMDPGYQLAPHLLILMDKLADIESGKSKRDQTFMPPQHGKTRTASELFAAWYLGRHPDKNLIFATYAQPLADTRGSAIRSLIQDPKHQAVFPDCRITHDSNSKAEFVFTRGGGLVALGRKAGGTGRRADGIILDDVIKDQEDADSDASRLEVKNFYSGVVITRLHNDTWIHIINTRWHLDDLSGWTLEEHEHENWNVLTLEAVCEEVNPANDPLGRQFGEALWPERQSLELLMAKKSSGTPRQWSALYQQRPVPGDGLTFNPAWFLKRLSDIADPGEKPTRIIQSWDIAQKDKQINDPSVCTTWHIFKRGVYLAHVFRGRLLYPALRKFVVEHAGIQHADLILVEAKSNGAPLVDDLLDGCSLPIKGLDPGGESKLIRAQRASSVPEGGRVAIPEEKETSWLRDYLIELTTFPASRHDDQVDSTSQFLNWYREYSRIANLTVLVSSAPRASRAITQGY